MSKSKVTLLDEILEMNMKMSDLFEECKIKPDHLSLPEEASDLPIDMIREGRNWLEDIFNEEYKAVRKVKDLLSDEQWARYKLWGSFEETQEMILLREKRIPFRKILVGRNRPDLFKKGKVNEGIKQSHTKKRG